MDWLYSEVQVWHLIAVVLAVLIVLFIVWPYERELEWFSDNNANRWINWKEDVNRQLSDMSETLWDIEDEIEEMRIPWWKRVMGRTNVRK